MAEELEKQGLAASVEGDSEESVHFFTLAIQHAPSEPRLYIYRAAEYIKLTNFSEAIADADRAIELDPLFWKAYYRKGVALHKLKEYEKAKATFEAGAALNPTYPKFKTLIALCTEALNLAYSKFKTNADGVKSVPPPAELEQSMSGASLNGQHTSADVASSGSSNSGLKIESDATPDDACSVAPVSVTPAVQAPVKPTFRHSYYQGPGYVSLSIFAKSLSKEDVHVDFGEQTLSVIISTGDGDPYALQLRLFGKIVVGQCKVTVGNTKVDIYLSKAGNNHWTQLEYSPQELMQPTPEVKVQYPSSSKKAPNVQYPSSSKKGPRDWDKLESEVKKEEKDEKLEGDAALNKLFREIYSGADEDTRRAMNKSYVESNGTVLSTNWKEVGSKQVVASPPQGMEPKKWET